ncbi:hypothetical protein QOT17_024665 [Balamuthia mandrillaris]
MEQEAELRKRTSSIGSWSRRGGRKKLEKCNQCDNNPGETTVDTHVGGTSRSSRFRLSAIFGTGGGDSDSEADSPSPSSTATTLSPSVGMDCQPCKELEEDLVPVATGPNSGGNPPVQKDNHGEASNTIATVPLQKKKKKKRKTSTNNGKAVASLRKGSLPALSEDAPTQRFSTSLSEVDLRTRTGITAGCSASSPPSSKGLYTGSTSLETIPIKDTTTQRQVVVRGIDWDSPSDSGGEPSSSEVESDSALVMVPLSPLPPPPPPPPQLRLVQQQQAQLQQPGAIKQHQEQQRKLRKVEKRLQQRNNKRRPSAGMPPAASASAASAAAAAATTTTTGVPFVVHLALSFLEREDVWRTLTVDSCKEELLSPSAMARLGELKDMLQNDKGKGGRKKKGGGARRADMKRQNSNSNNKEELPSAFTTWSTTTPTTPTSPTSWTGPSAACPIPPSASSSRSPPEALSHSSWQWGNSNSQADLSAGCSPPSSASSSVTTSPIASPRPPSNLFATTSSAPSSPSSNPLKLSSDGLPPLQLPVPRFYVPSSASSSEVHVVASEQLLVSEWGVPAVVAFLRFYFQQEISLVPERVYRSLCDAVEIQSPSVRASAIHSLLFSLPIRNWELLHRMLHLLSCVHRFATTKNTSVNLQQQEPSNNTANKYNNEESDPTLDALLAAFAASLLCAWRPKEGGGTVVGGTLASPFSPSLGGSCSIPIHEKDPASVLRTMVLDFDSLRDATMEVNFTVTDGGRMVLSSIKLDRLLEKMLDENFVEPEYIEILFATYSYFTTCGDLLKSLTTFYTSNNQTSSSWQHQIRIRVLSLLLWWLSEEQAYLEQDPTFMKRATKFVKGMPPFLDEDSKEQELFSQFKLMLFPSKKGPNNPSLASPLPYSLSSTASSFPPPPLYVQDPQQEEKKKKNKHAKNTSRKASLETAQLPPSSSSPEKNLDVGSSRRRSLGEKKPSGKKGEERETEKEGEGEYQRQGKATTSPFPGIALHKADSVFINRAQMMKAERKKSLASNTLPSPQSSSSATTEDTEKEEKVQPSNLEEPKEKVTGGEGEPTLKKKKKKKKKRKQSITGNEYQKKKESTGDPKGGPAIVLNEKTSKEEHSAALSLDLPGEALLTTLQNIKEDEAKNSKEVIEKDELFSPRSAWKAAVKPPHPHQPQTNQQELPQHVRKQEPEQEQLQQQRAPKIPTEEIAGNGSKAMRGAVARAEQRGAEAESVSSTTSVEGDVGAAFSRKGKGSLIVLNRVKMWETLSTATAQAITAPTAGSSPPPNRPVAVRFGALFNKLSTEHPPPHLHISTQETTHKSNKNEAFPQKEMDAPSKPTTQTIPTNNAIAEEQTVTTSDKANSISRGKEPPSSSPAAPPPQHEQVQQRTDSFSQANDAPSAALPSAISVSQKNDLRTSSGVDLAEERSNTEVTGGGTGEKEAERQREEGIREATENSETEGNSGGGSETTEQRTNSDPSKVLVRTSTLRLFNHMALGVSRKNQPTEEEIEVCPEPEPEPEQEERGQEGDPQHDDNEPLTRKQKRKSATDKLYMLMAKGVRSEHHTRSSSSETNSSLEEEQDEQETRVRLRSGSSQFYSLLATGVTSDGGSASALNKRSHFDTDGDEKRQQTGMSAEMREAFVSKELESWEKILQEKNKAFTDIRSPKEGTSLKNKNAREERGKANNADSSSSATEAPISVPFIISSLRAVMQVKTPFMSFDPAAICKELTRIDGQHFVEINRKELLHKRFMVSERSPTFTAMVTRFNMTGLWVASEVFKYDTAAERGQVLAHFIKICRECKKMRNFNSLFALLGGLNNTAISRLRLSWEKVSGTLMKKYRSLMKLAASDKNYACYRQLLNRCKGPVVPYLALFSKDLFTIEETHPTTTIDGLVNFDKLRLLWKILSLFKRCQQSPFSLDVNHSIHSYLMNDVTAWSEAEQYQLSYSMEPRGARNTPLKDNQHM